MQFKFLNLAKPKKVFEKLNKMDRKQAYTVGAIIVVAVVALLMFVSALDSEDNSLEGMSARGYDLASMPFVSDLAEQELLASRYPDMKENGSSFLYTAAQKEQRQEEDQAAEAEMSADDPLPGSVADENATDVYARGGSGNGAGRLGGRGYGGAGRSKTEIGTLASAGMASAGGSGIGATWGPSVDNRGFQGQTGYVAPAQLKTDDARKTLGQFRAGSYAANRLRDNKNLNARKAMMGGNVQGSQAFGKNGIDASKLGGLALDTSELPKTSDLGNLDDAVDNAVKEQQKKEEKEKKLSFWEQLGQDLLRSFAKGLVDAVTTGVGDSLKGWVNGNSASRAAGKKAWAEMQGKPWSELSAADQATILEADKNAATTWGTTSCKATYGNTGKYLSDIAAKRYEAYSTRSAQSIGSTRSPTTQLGQQQGGGSCSPADSAACKAENKTAKVVNGVCVCQ